MKVVSINASLPENCYGLNIVNRVVYDTFLELGEYIEEILLSSKNLPYLNNQTPDIELVNIINTIQSSDGVIFSFNVNLFAPNALLQTFLDYLSYPMYKNILKDKNCYIIAVSNNSGEKQAVEYLTRVIQYLGGYPSVISAFNSSIAYSIETDQHNRNVFEKQVEDFYRFVKQGREFFIPCDAPISKQIVTVNDSKRIDAKVSDNNFSRTQPISQIQQQINPQMQQSQPNYNNEPMNRQVRNPEPMQPLHSTNIQNNFDQVSRRENDTTFIQHNMLKAYDAQTQFSDTHQRRQTNTQDTSDLNEIAKMLQEKQYQKQTRQNRKVNDMPKIDGMVNAHRADEYLRNDFAVNQDLEPKNMSVYHLTKRLEHFYQPHLSNGIKMNIALTVTGEENFDVAIVINGTECMIQDGQVDKADTTIIASSNIWNEVLSGSVSIQKAFMTGQIKVKGNFILLSKFDQLFKLS